MAPWENRSQVLSVSQDAGIPVASIVYISVFVTIMVMSLVLIFAKTISLGNYSVRDTVKRLFKNLEF